MSKSIKKDFTTISGLPLKEVYKASNVTGLQGVGELEAGAYPYTRGIHKSMYRERLWTMRQYAGFGSAIETNQRYHFLLSQGTTGLSVAFDLPTQMGHDSDHSLAKGEVGRVGVAISSLDDMRLLLKDIPLERVSISMTINSTACILLSMLLIVAEERNVSWTNLRGTVQNDILKEYIARGTYIYPPKHALRLVTDLFSFCAENVPAWNTISISGYHIREAGSTAVQELAFTFANAVTYVEAALKSGLKIDDFAPRLAFFFNCHNCFLEEIAKFRAARKVWARIISERFGTSNERSQLLRFHTQTAGSSLTAQQPLNNVVRTSLQALAAVLGGTQSLHTNSYDEALGLPTEDSAELALRTQQIIAHESGVSDVVDPLGGSYLIEDLTTRIEAEVFSMLEKIDKMGGMLKAIEEGFPQQEIENSAYEFQKRVEESEYQVVGVNSYQREVESPIKILKIDPKVEKEQVKRLKLYKKSRGTSFQKGLADLKIAAADTKANLMLAVINALRNNATLGEISDVLRAEFGNYNS